MRPEKAKQYLSLAGFDVLRLLVMLAGISLLFWLSNTLPAATGESALAPLLSSTAIVLTICLVSHFTRRILFPNQDMTAFAKVAFEHPVGAGLVFFSICIVLATIINASVTLLR